MTRDQIAQLRAIRAELDASFDAARMRYDYGRVMNAHQMVIELAESAKARAPAAKKEGQS